MEPKPRHRSKTNWFGFALILFSGLQAQMPVIQEFVTPERYSYIMFGVGLLVIILRELTKDPVG